MGFLTDPPEDPEEELPVGAEVTEFEGCTVGLELVVEEGCWSAAGLRVLKTFLTASINRVLDCSVLAGSVSDGYWNTKLLLLRRSSTKEFKSSFLVRVC